MSDIQQRKADHIEIGLTRDVSMSKHTGFERYYFVHQALPELALEDVSLETTFLGQTIGAPILISSMTGGNTMALTINQNLGKAAEALRVPMAVGSQRIMFEHPEAMASFKAAREAAPTIPMFGNFGAVQLNYGVTIEHIQQAVDMLEASGIFLHLNPLQEVVQTGGDTNFRNLLNRIGEVAATVTAPILIKEVGCGISPELAVALANKGVAAIDVSGAGGTSWASIEALRATDARKQRLGQVFSDWGIPTVESLQLCRNVLPEAYPLIASGGIRTGLDVAKAIALGADLVGFAMPLLEPATRSSEDVVNALQQIMEELRAAMFLIGVRDIPTLKASRHLLKEVN